MSIQLTQLKLNKDAYMKVCHLVSSMEKYSYWLHEDDEKELRVYARLSQGMPLPSGRWGNAIALALETNDYISANYLIEHAEELDLETDSVVSEIGRKNPRELKDEFLFSLLTFESLDEDKISDMKNVLGTERTEKIIEHNNRQLLAIKWLEEKLSITNEDKKIIGR